MLESFPAGLAGSRRLGELRPKTLLKFAAKRTVQEIADAGLAPTTKERELNSLILAARQLLAARGIPLPKGVPAKRPAAPGLCYTDEQERAIEMAVASVRKGQQLFRIGGYAGTGKTSVARAIFAAVPGGAACAFTGKAVHVLRRKGISGAVSTMHSLIYTWNDGAFTRRRSLECDWVLLDEGSMVSTELWKDLRSFRLPVVVCGDCGQLEPIGDDPRLMKDPDIVLQEIHRQEEQSAIIEFATVLRQRRPYKYGTKGEVDVVPPESFEESYGWADQLICGRNATRVRTNEAVRSLKGRRGLLEPGERLMVLANDTRLGVFNGMQLEVVEIVKEERDVVEARCVGDDGRDMGLCKLNTTCLGRSNGITTDETFAIKSRNEIPVEYAYCITCHKAQGSEWDKVAVLEQKNILWDQVRWSYTAATRAAERLRFACFRP